MSNDIDKSPEIRSYEHIYRKEPDGVSFCPYRVCPIGAHSDHNLGKVTGFAIDRGIGIAYGKKNNGVIELNSLQFDKRAQWHISSVPDRRQNDWADYLRGATLSFAEKHPLHAGLSGVINGSLPIGGLSSSAAVIIAFLKALYTVNGIDPEPDELINAALKAETDYVGVSVGKLDQSCEVYCKRDHLLYLDTLDGSFELIPASPVMKPWEIMIFFSGIERTLAGSKYNMRVDEAKSAAYALKAFAGMEYGKFGDTHLREVPFDVYEENKSRLPENWRKRAEHWYTEFDRVEKGARAWRRGDIDAFGRLSFESGASSISKWETGSPELKTLYDIMTETDGIYGGRFSGAGFKGCCMALVDPAFEESIEREVTERYLAAFPELRGRFSVHVCHSADGVGKV
ncbi:MAG: GHMP kinase [Clostridia bacterium]|nr:GHMP kinase [Clostridia bacterium]